MWDLVGVPAPVPGLEVAVPARELRTFTLDRLELEAILETAPREFSRAARTEPLEVSLPSPSGGFERFAVQESPVMEPGLARRHPDIRTYNGSGIDDPTATIRFDLTPTGFHASVRSSDGTWFIDPYYRLDQRLYASYFSRDLENVHGKFVERGLQELEHAHAEEESASTSEAAVPVGEQLRTYRLALVTEQSYANYHNPPPPGQTGPGPNPENVTAAKVTLVNRVTQIYEDETSIRMILIADNDRLNLDTDALAIEANGPCGTAPCYTAAQLNSCSSGLLNQNRFVIGQIIGASNYDIGHIGLGKSGGGIAQLGVVGRSPKARGCTGVPAPTGDFFAVDYVAHEMGHQYAGNHTFNGALGSCAGNASLAGTQVEPGSGSSIMAYAGICAQDNLQPNSDPYWSLKSFDEITTYVTADRNPDNEVQNVALRNFDGTDSFKLTYGGGESPVIQRGTNYDSAGIRNAILAIPTWPAGADVSVTGFWGSGSPNDNGFQVTFTGTLAQQNASLFGFVPVGGDVTGWSGETDKGGPVDNKGWVVSPTGNSTPQVTVPASFTIPYQTPFELTGSATDADGDVLTYMWEQNNAGITPHPLLQPDKTEGPLFRQFGTALRKPPYDPTQYYSPGENHPTTDPTRVFPDIEQILANNTNQETSACPSPPTDASGNAQAQAVECYSEYLPTPSYPGPMVFRLTARDNSPGGGGVNHAQTTISLAPASQPFLVTSHGSGSSYRSRSTQTVTWLPGSTAAPPINAANVDILLSIDGGRTYPYTLAAETPNDGTQAVVIPSVEAEEARIKVKPVGNVFFDISNANSPITNTAPAAYNDAPGGRVSVEQNEPLSPAVTVWANDPDSWGSDLSATVSGLPSGLSMTPVSSSADGTLPGTATWAVDGSTTQPPGTYEVTVTVRDGPNSATTTFAVEVLPGDLSVTTQASSDTAKVGSPLTLTTTVRNLGTGAQRRVDLTHTLPEAAILLDVAGESGDSCVRRGDRVECDLDTLASGESTVVRFVVAPALPGSYRLRGSVVGSDGDATPADAASGILVAVERPRCTVRGTGADNRLTGTRGDDVICGRGGDDRIRGRGGNDLLIGAGGRDTIKAGSGIDVAWGGGRRDRIRITDRVASNDAAIGGRGRDSCRVDRDDVARGCP